MIGNCSTDSLFALVLSSVISPHDKIGLNEVQDRYRGVVGGPQKLCVVISVKKADTTFVLLSLFQIGCLQNPVILRDIEPSSTSKQC